MSLPWLKADTKWFPPSSLALEDPNGLLAAGGDLSPSRLIAAYYRGIFPWYNDDQPILWWTPSPRAVFFPEKVHVSRSLKKHIRQNNWLITIDNRFDSVIEACSAPRTYADGTWLSSEMKIAYNQLHQMGYAHSVEVWQDSLLVGGIYGINLGKVFFGESMFSQSRNGSKVALIALANVLTELGVELIDCQVGNPHLYSMGAENLTRTQFEKCLQQWATPAFTTIIQYKWTPLRLRQYSCDHLIQP